MPAQRGDDPRKAAGYKPSKGPPGNKVELHPPVGRFHAGVPTPKPQHKAVGQVPVHEAGHARKAPIIPRVQHPNPAQIHEALKMAHAHQTAELGKSPTAADVKAFQRRLPPDYIQTVAHYVNAGSRLRGEAIGVKGSALAPEAPFRHVRINKAGTLELAPEDGKPAQDTSMALLTPRERAAVTEKKGTSLFGLKIGQQKSLLGEAQSRREQVRGKYHPEINVAFPAPALVKFAAATGGAAKVVGAAHGPKAIQKELAEVGIVPLVTGERGIEAAGAFIKGDHKPLHDLLGQVAKGVTGGVIGKVAKGDIHGALQYAKNHMVFTAAELLAAKAIAGRGGGVVVRGAGKPGPGIRGKLHKVGSPTLDPYGHTGRYRPGMAIEENIGSKDLLAKGRQRAAQVLFHPKIRDAEGNPVTRVVRGQTRVVREPGGHSRKFIPNVIKKHGGERLQQKRADFEVYRGQVRQANEIARVHQRMRGAVNKQVGPVTIPFRKLSGKAPVKIEGYMKQGGGGRYMSHQNLATHLVPLVMRNEIRTTRTFKTDLKARIDEIQDAIKKDDFSDAIQRGNAKRNVAILKAAYESDAVMGQAKKIVQVAEKLGREGNKADDVLAGKFQIPAERSLRARLIPHAEKHMGATHYDEQRLAEAEAKAKAEGKTRAEQIEVSGRDPALMHHHEIHEARYAASKSALKTAQGRKDKAVARFKERKAAANRSKLKDGRYSAADRKVLAAADKEQKAAIADLKAVRKMHSKVNKERIPLPERQEGFRKANGEHLSTDEIIKDIRKSGRNPDTVAYLPDMVENGVNMDQFQAAVGRRPSVGPGANLGILRSRGVSSFNPDIIEREFERKASMTLRAQQLDKYVQEQGQKHPDGGYWSAKSGGAQVKRINAEVKEKYGETRPGDEVMLFRAYPARTDRALKPEIRDLQQATPIDETAYGMLKERTSFDAHSGERNAVIVTRSQLKRMEKHFEEGRRVNLMQQLMVPFRMAVLPQPKWLLGNFIEPFFIRLPAIGSGAWLPGLAADTMAFRKGIKILREGTPKQKELASELEAQYGSMLSGSRTATESHTWEQFTGRRRSLMKVMHELRVNPVLKPIEDLALTPFKFFFELNRRMEGGIQRAAFGHQLRAEIADLTGSYGKAVIAQKAALRDVMNGFENTAQQQRFFEATNEILGKYNGWSPTMKRMVTTYTPFIPWAAAALRFVYWTLPVKHPVKFNALMKTGEQLMAEWEAEHVPVTPPGELRYAQKIGDDEFRNWGKFGPIGATLPVANAFKSAAEGKVGEAELGELTQPLQYIVPPFQGPIEAARGRDFAGNPLRDEPTPSNPKGDLSLWDRVGFGLKQVAGETLPGVAGGMRVAEGSGSNYANSMPWAPKTKPGSEHGQAWERMFNPFRTTKYKKKDKGKSGGLGAAGLGKAGLGSGGLGPGGLGQ